MYRFSRAIYQELAPAVQSGPDDPDGSKARKRLLEASEDTIRRMVDNRHLARPWKTLFIDIRFDFSLIDQRMVAETLERHLRLARTFIEHQRKEMSFRADHCRGLSRAGDPCRRAPLEGREFCPSHSHLEELWEGGGEEAQPAEDAEPELALSPQ